MPDRLRLYDPVTHTDRDIIYGDARPIGGSDHATIIVARGPAGWGSHVYLIDDRGTAHVTLMIIEVDFCQVVSGDLLVCAQRAAPGRAPNGRQLVWNLPPAADLIGRA